MPSTAAQTSSGYGMSRKYSTWHWCKAVAKQLQSSCKGDMLWRDAMGLYPVKQTSSSEWWQTQARSQLHRSNPHLVAAWARVPVAIIWQFGGAIAQRRRVQRAQLAAGLAGVKRVRWRVALLALCTKGCCGAVGDFAVDAGAQVHTEASWPQHRAGVGRGHL